MWLFYKETQNFFFAFFFPPRFFVTGDTVKVAIWCNFFRTKIMVLLTGTFYDTPHTCHDCKYTHYYNHYDCDITIPQIHRGRSTVGYMGQSGCKSQVCFHSPLMFKCTSLQRASQIIIISFIGPINL